MLQWRSPVTSWPTRKRARRNYPVHFPQRLPPRCTASETATLCLRRLGEAFTTGLEDAVDAGVRDLMRDGASRAVAATAATEALGDLSLDLLDRLVDPRI